LISRARNRPSDQKGRFGVKANQDVRCAFPQHWNGKSKIPLAYAKGGDITVLKSPFTFVYVPRPIGLSTLIKLGFEIQDSSIGNGVEALHHVGSRHVIPIHHSRFLDNEFVR